ncbi:MAG: Na+/H+ antiporter NhaA [Bacteroidota bacterium]|jgi:NhaA family Na+:H+ antiporter|nr:Na+/H+ antiporter NhaA [Terrimonas sp.]
MSGTQSSNSRNLVFTRLFLDFFKSEKFSGFLLIGCTALSLLVANSSWGENYAHFWHYPFAGLTVELWINDGLMAIFFLLVGLEIEREIYIGELSTFRLAILPIVAALGGMLVPAGIHLLLNNGTPTASGAGIPMATDIAFALGILSLAGKAVPPAIKVFLTALAIIDDLGAILVIALFYTEQLSILYLSIALLTFALLFFMGKKGITKGWVYGIGGLVLWYCMFRSGVHATISGVLLAFAIPFGKGGDQSLSARLQHFLHPIVAYFIVPVFALANTGIILSGEILHTLGSVNSLGIMMGLTLGKPIGIVLFSAVAVQIKTASLPSGVAWKHIMAAGMLAGIGFTMSIFITILAFPDSATIVSSKVAILVASLLSAFIGLFTFRLFGSRSIQ